MKLCVLLDDTFGDVSLQMRPNDAGAVQKLLERAKEHSGLRVIMTTRDYILHAAHSRNDKLELLREEIVERLELADDPRTRAEMFGLHVLVSPLSMAMKYHLCDCAPFVISRRWPPRTLARLMVAAEQHAASPAEFSADPIGGIISDPAKVW